MIRAVLFDYGGVIAPGPFEGFARYEREHGLPSGFIRRLNATNPERNAWACLERGEIVFDEFCTRFEEEAHSAGGEIDAREVMAVFTSDPRPEMVEAVRRCRRRLKTAVLTNNWIATEGSSWAHDLGELFDLVLESSRIGVRKPDPRFYAIACEKLGIGPGEAVFLDDLGVNLKPARGMGMVTIKVTDALQAIVELEQVVGFPLR